MAVASTTVMITDYESHEAVEFASPMRRIQPGPRRPSVIMPPRGFTLTEHTEAAIAAHVIRPIAAIIIAYLTPFTRPPGAAFSNIRDCKTETAARLYWHNRIADFAAAGFYEPCHRAIHSKAPEDAYIRKMSTGLNGLIAAKFAANGYLPALRAIMRTDSSASWDVIAAAAAHNGHSDIIDFIIATGVEFTASDAISAANSAGHLAIAAALRLYDCSAATLYADEWGRQF